MHNENNNMAHDSIESLDWRTVKSSNVQAVAFETTLYLNEEETGNLYIRFKSGTVYKYSNVPEKKFTALRKAPSAGKYLSQHVKGLYEYQSLSERGV